MSMSDQGKAPAPILHPSGDVFVFFNDYNTLTATDFLNADGTVLYTYNPSTTAAKSAMSLNYRYLQYKRFTPSDPLASVKVGFVPWVEDDQDYSKAVPVLPLYEAINPVATYLDNHGAASLVFWTNLATGGDTFKITDTSSPNVGKYVYDSTKVALYQQDQLSSVTIPTNSTRALLAIRIEFKMLGQAPTGTQPTTNLMQLVPIATKPMILDEQKGFYPILDFSSGGGTGMRLHSHLNNSMNQGGYCFAVLAPGTSTPMLPWES